MLTIDETIGRWVAGKISRRAFCKFLPASGLLFALGCGIKSGPYYGKATPPSNGRLRYVIGGEPDTLDPSKYTSDPEVPVINSLFEGLTGYHPETLEPIGALATHYETSGDLTQFIFYLRGHPNPQGVHLPDSSSLQQEYIKGQIRQDYTRGHGQTPNNGPALWSDGVPVTAHDFVYSWRRALDSKTAASRANFLYCIENGEQINRGLLPPDKLGVRAIDDFTLLVMLRAPTAFFLKLTSWRPFFPVPPQALEAARLQGNENRWTRPGTIVTNGPFVLSRWESYDEILVAKNPLYYESELVNLREIQFVPVSDQVTSVNLYKAGYVDGIVAWMTPRLFVPILRRAKDFHSSQALMSTCCGFNITRPPFNNLLVRYAISMATDKAAIAAFLDSGEIPSVFVPPVGTYVPPKQVLVNISGKNYDVVSYDPEAAKELLAQAGFAGGKDNSGVQLKVEVLTTNYGSWKQVAEILQQQWQSNLNIEVDIADREFKAYVEEVGRVQFSGVALNGWAGQYVDPNSLLEVFDSKLNRSGTGWADPTFDRMLAEANSTPTAELRNSLLVECESYILRAMPIVPLFSEVRSFLAKPYVKGIAANLIDNHPWKYVWIDADWRLSD